MHLCAQDDMAAHSPASLTRAHARKDWLGVMLRVWVLVYVLVLALVLSSFLALLVAVEAGRWRPDSHHKGEGVREKGSFGFGEIR